MTLAGLPILRSLRILENNNKPGKLSDDEWNEIKSHCEIGYKILDGIDGADGELRACFALDPQRGRIERQREILHWMHEGKTNWEIARILDVDVHDINVANARYLAAKAARGAHSLDLPLTLGDELGLSELEDLADIMRLAPGFFWLNLAVLCLTTSLRLSTRVAGRRSLEDGNTECSKESRT